MRVLSTSSSTTSVSNISLILTVLRVLPLLLLLPFGESQSIYSTRSGGGSSSNADEVESHDDILYAYFETPLENDVGHIGPTHWLDLDIANNQCGKGGQKNGFGQSPVVFPYRLTNYEECTSNLDGYETFDGNCSWADVEYPISKGILALKPKKDPNGIPYCSLGKWKIPQSDALYEVTEVHLKHGAEHALEGYQEMVELQVFHEDEKHETRAAFSIRMNPNFSQDAISNDVIDNMLNGWRTTYWKTHDYCSTHENGSGIFNVNTVLEAHQKLIVCQELDNRPDAETYIRDTVPPSSSLLIPNFVSVGSIIPKDFNILTYEGSLTTPPCTENVYWNVVRESQDIITYQEYVEIMNIVNCVKEESTCELGSVASEFGLTKRPPQMLDGRKIAHRCVDGPSTKYEKAEVPETEVYEKEEENEPVWALLFPFTITFIGLIVFYISGRFIPLVPYTAILFLVGTIMGVIMVSDPNNQLERSIYMWDDIDGELLLIAFLPGLLFKDAYCLDVHLFEKAFVQILIMAFPMVLAGTTLMAVFAFYILPYDWTFNFCMTFGAILSATDPVAVSALLQELGAPPRLKTHISGESLMNDGSAIVFFTIFYKLFLEEQNLPGGEVIGLGSGVYMFIKMSIFAALLGIAFGIGLIGILYMLNRRFNTEEKIVQVTATFCIAYVSYYIAEAVFHLSGVITVVFCGLITKYFASSLIIDHDMMDKFWALTEHLLNTVLFALGGVVWGSVIGNANDRQEEFTGADWGYLFLTFIFMTVIRFLLFGAFFPIVSRIGLKSNWKEMVFQAFGGLRGAVGIALAINLDHKVISGTVGIDPKRIPSTQLFGIVGGITLLTLFINGTAAGPLLKKLKLNRSTKERMDILKRYDAVLRKSVSDTLIILLGEAYYRNIDFDFIVSHVPQLANLSYKELRSAIRRVKHTTPAHLYQEPDLSMLKSSNLSDKEFEQLEKTSKLKLFERIQSDYNAMAIEVLPDKKDKEENPTEDELREMRLVFIELLRGSYQQAMDKGHIDARDITVVYALNRSVALTEDEISNGKPIKDWEKCFGIIKTLKKYDKRRTKVHLASSFIQAHTEAERIFKYKVHQQGFLSNVERQILDESIEQKTSAYGILEGIEPLILRKIMSLKLCNVLLNAAAINIAAFVKGGLLKEEEGEHYLEHLEEDLREITQRQNEKEDQQTASIKYLNRQSFLKLPTFDLNNNNAANEEK